MTLCNLVVLIEESVKLHMYVCTVHTLLENIDRTPAKHLTFSNNPRKKNIHHATANPEARPPGGGGEGDDMERVETKGQWMDPAGGT